MARALDFPRPQGVIDAEKKLRAGIVAEMSAFERKVVVENSRGPFILRFMNPHESWGEIMEVMRSLDAKGYEFAPGQWVRDRQGVINGIAFEEITRSLA